MFYFFLTGNFVRRAQPSGDKANLDWLQWETRLTGEQRIQN